MIEPRDKLRKRGRQRRKKKQRGNNLKNLKEIGCSAELLAVPERSEGDLPRRKLRSKSMRRKKQSGSLRRKRQRLKHTWAE